MYIHSIIIILCVFVIMFLMDYLFSKIPVDRGNNLINIQFHEAIPAHVVFQIFELVEGQKLSREESLARVRSQLVPEGYEPHPFRKNTPESHLDRLRSVVATYLFRHSICCLQREGVDFATYMYVPEVDPTTGVEHHHRADHGHLLKRIAGTILYKIPR